MNKFACFFIPNQSNRRLVTLILPLTKHMNIILLYLHTRICLKYRCLPIWNISSMDILSLSLSLSLSLQHTDNNFFSHLTKSNSWYSFEASLLLSVIDFNVSDEMRWDCLKRLNCQTNKFSDSDLPTAVDALVVDLIV